MAELTLTDINASIASLRDELAAERADRLQATKIIVALLAQHGDPTHVTIERAAALRGCSVKTIRRSIDAGNLTLEVIPGTRESGIPIEQIYSRWVPIRVAREALRKMRTESQGCFMKRSGAKVRATSRRRNR
jgi:hypothetical protein